MQTALLILLVAVMLAEAGIIALIFIKYDNATANVEFMTAQCTDLTKENNELLNRLALYGEAVEKLTEEKALLTDLFDEALSRIDEKSAPEPQQEEKSGTVTSSLLPPSDISTNMFMAEPFDHFAANSEQAILQDECFTDTETGLRYIIIDRERFYCAALAGAYGIEIGKCFRFTLQNGRVLNIILADFKHPIDDPQSDDYGDICEHGNYDGMDAMCIIEFIADFAFMPKAVKDAGTYSVLPQFGGLHGKSGNIVNVEALGRKWRA